MKIIYLVSFILAIVPRAMLSAQNETLICQSHYLVDENSQITIDSLKKIPQNSLKSFDENEELKFGFNKSKTIWCVISLQNKEAIIQTKWFVLHNIYLDSVVFYDGDKITICGDRTYSNDAVSIQPSCLIQLQPSSSTTLYIKIKKIHSYLDFSYSLEPELSFIRDSQNTIIVVAISLGITGLFWLFNFILFIVSKEKIYLNYSIYVFFMLVYISISSGFAKYFIFPEFLYFSEFRIYSSFIMGTTLNIFIQQYVKLYELNSKLHKAITRLIYLNWFILLVSGLLYYFEQFQLIKIITITAYVNILVIMLLTLYGILWNIKKLKIRAFFALSSYYFMVIWAIIFIVRETTKFTIPIKIDWLVALNIYEVVLFGIILAFKYYKTIQDNQHLLQNIIVEKEKSISAFDEGEKVERKRLASILHDNFGSRLAVIQNLLSQHEEEKTKEQIKLLSNDIRNLSHQIMPRSLQEGALKASIQKQVDLYNELNNILKIELYCFDMPETINKSWIYDVYLITQEIITNALKHSGATLLTIELYAYDNEFVFHYTDNGNGFNPASIVSGTGLENMEYRIKKFGGKFALSSTVSNGTDTIIQLPK